MSRWTNVAGLPAAQAPGVGTIIAVLKERTGTDFTLYRPATIERRIRNRMIALGIQDHDHYLARLRADEAETQCLMDRVTIKVSRFYRNRVTFDALRKDALPTLIAQAGTRPLQLWSAGCGFGEEPYTLAMLLDEQGRMDVVHATDIDLGALERARTGVYPEEAVDELPDELRERYLERVVTSRGVAYRVRDVLRERVRFVRHDLTKDEPPLAGVTFDLVCCRNVFIYLQQATQALAFSTLCARVAPGGVLCLGEAELPPPAQGRRLKTLDRRARLFRVPSTCTHEGAGT